MLELADQGPGREDDCGRYNELDESKLVQAINEALSGLGRP